MDLESAVREAVVRLDVQNLDAFEVLGMCERLLAIEVKQQRVERYHRSEGAGISIRAISDGRLGLAATTELTAKSVHQSVQAAIAALQRTSPSPESVLPHPQKGGGALEERAGTPLGEVPESAKVEAALALESAAYAADSRVTRVQRPRYEEQVRELVVVNSHGVDAEASRSLCSCEVKVVAEEAGGAESAYEFACAAAFDRLHPEAIAKAAAVRAASKLGARATQGGNMPVLFDPRAAAQLVKLLSNAFFADNVQRGKSILRGKLRERFYHPSVTVVDDGLLPDGYGSFCFDAEGIPHRRTLLIRDGVIESWLYDGARAARDGVTSTGNCAREALNRPPSIGITNCFLKAGAQSREELVREVQRGILVTDLLGVHTANAISGAFSLGIEGRVIEGGHLGDPIRGMTIAGNVHGLFKGVGGIGNDLTFFGPCGAPTLLVENLMVSS
jgi:PmbA protein